MIVEKYYDVFNVVVNDKKLYIRTNYCLVIQEIYLVKWDMSVVGSHRTKNTEDYLKKIFKNV